MFWRGKNKFNHLEMVGSRTLIGFGSGPSPKGNTYYVDTNTANHWGMNYRGNSIIEPIGQ